MSDSDAVHAQAIHLHPTAPLAERVLLPGDPGRALALAQPLLREPLMFNHNRGLWGYTGDAVADEQPLTIQATGMGGPSAAIVLSELISLGARRAIRVGTCGALSRELALGELVIAGEAVCADGASRAISRHAARARRRGADARRWSAARRRRAPARSSASTCSTTTRRAREHPGDALAIEMEAATLFALGAARDVPVACLLAVTDTFDEQGARTRIGADALREAAERMGAVALDALAQ